MIFRKNKFAGYKLNWKPSPKDPRDFKFSALLSLRQVSAPPTPSADVSAIIPEVFDQGQIGSCTGNAGAMLGLYQSRKQNREITPSRLMLYYGAREIEGTTSADDGAFIRDIFKAMAKVGVAPESVWAYDESKVVTRPSAQAYDEGKKTLAVVYRALDNTNLDELKTCIALGHPFELGFTVYNQFMFGSWKEMMPMPKPGENILGGHAVTAVGYDDTRKAFRIKNSWGTDWKSGGYFWMPYAFITSPDYCDDFWMLEQITPANVPDPTPSNITSIVDLKKVITAKADFTCMKESVIVRIGHEMGLNTDNSKSKSQNIAIVLGGLGL
jgi:C1A family cysteine protease